MMNSATQTPANPRRDGLGPSQAARHFWLAQVDEDLPRAALVPDFKRSRAGLRSYGESAFVLDARAASVLRAVPLPAAGGDAVICATLVAMLMGKLGRDDRLVAGLSPAPGSGPLPISLPCASTLTFAQAAAALSDDLTQCLAHPADEVARLPGILGLEGDSHRYPLYDLALAVAPEGAALDLAAYPVDMVICFNTAGESIRGNVVYARDLYEPETAARVARMLEALASQLGRAPGLAASRSIGELRVLDDDSRRQVLSGFNARSAAYPLHETFHSLFEAQVRRTPQAVAAIHRQARLTYTELNERANRLAHLLLAQGLPRGGFVGLLLHRGCDFAVAMLAVFKAGGAYVPLDPTYPRDRITYMLEDSEAGFLVTDAALATSYAEAIAACHAVRTLVTLDAEAASTPSPERPELTRLGRAAMAAAPTTDPVLALTGRDRAYMIYTSGSTGRPKGAICRHDGALNHLFGELDGVGVTGAFNFLQTAASSSDISVWQFMAPLVRGGATVVADYETVVDPPALAALMREHAVDVAEPVPVVLRALLDHLAALPPAQRGLPALKVMMCTGEALSGELVNRWLAMFPDVPIANTYGPTETSDDVTLLVLREPIGHQFAVTPIGPPLPNVRIFVLDRELQPVPLGVPGELCVAGVAVGEGYWNQPEKTAAAFVPCPFPEVAQGLMYRTGDLCRWLPDGSIEFLGRIDQQIKLRGFRVEPGEIEQMITRHPSVQDAAVVVVEDAAGTRRLAGHYVLHKGQELPPAELRRYLKDQLAEHMVPALLAPAPALPLTPLGKVDRRALARMAAPAEDAPADYAAPVTELQGRLAALWSRVTGAARVGLHDNFFEIGGDSILTIHVVAALREQGLEIAPRDLFKHPTVAELAAALATPRSAATEAADGVRRADAMARAEAAWDVPRWRAALVPLFGEVEDVYPLSATQRGIYFQSLLVPRTSGAYVEQLAFDLLGPVDPERFAAAWQRVIERTEALRTAVVRRGAPFPLQAVLRHATIEPAQFDLSGLPTEQQRQRLEQMMLEDRAKGFDLKRPPLARVTLVRLSNQRWHVLWSYHHLILDGWVEPMIVRAVMDAYVTLGGDELPPHRAAPRYRDFVLWSEAQDPAPSEAFWRGQLAGFTTPVTPRDLSAGITPPSVLELSHGWETRTAPPDLAGSLESGVRRQGITLATLLHGAWALLVGRHTRADDVLVGTVSSGRQCPMPGVADVVGLVVNTLPLRTRLDADLRVGAWLRLLQSQMADLREHEQVPLAQIVQWSEVPPERRPLFDTLVVVGNYEGVDLAFGEGADLRVDSVRYATQPLFALTLFATVQPSLELSLVYDRRRYSPDHVRTLLDAYTDLLRALAEGPDLRLGAVHAVRPRTK